MNIELDDVTCGYGNKVVIRGFTGVVPAGRVTCLLGPNGVGKSTLFKSTLGVQPLLGGTVRVGGRDIGRIAAYDRARLVGYVPQSQQNPFAFRVLDVVVMGRTARLGRFGSPGRSDRVTAWESLDSLGAADLANKAFGELSGGERQLVMIARALASSLDFGNQVRVLREIRRLAESGIGVLMTTHAPDHASLCGGDVVLLRGGADHLAGSAEDVLTAANLGAAYGVDVEVTHTVRDGVVIVQCRPLLESPSDRTARKSPPMFDNER